MRKTTSEYINVFTVFDPISLYWLSVYLFYHILENNSQNIIIIF